MKADWDLKPDHDRKARLGFDETIFCEGKSVDQITRVLDGAANDAEPLLLTRLDQDKCCALPAVLRQELDYDEVSQTGIFGAPQPLDPSVRVAVVCAGSSDVRVACEASRTLHYYGIAASNVFDVGVAGLWRLLEAIDELRHMSVVICVAGMEGTLPGVVAGMVSGAVIAVPTSNGYGVAAGGKAALSSALASCAPGLLVVNIDNGYGAACAALRILNIGRRSAVQDAEVAGR